MALINVIPLTCHSMNTEPPLNNTVFVTHRCLSRYWNMFLREPPVCTDSYCTGTAVPWLQSIAAWTRVRETVHIHGDIGNGTRARLFWTRREAEKLAVLDMLRSRDRAVKLTAMLLVCFSFQQRMPQNALRSSRDEHAYMNGFMQLLK